jgi:hypothetical protein
MTSSIDSKATFLARCAELGFPSGELRSLGTKPWASLAGFAFAANYQPGGTDDSALKNLAKTFVEEVDLDERMPAVRRLFYESFTLAAADLKRKLDVKDYDEPRKMAMPERRQRIRSQRVKLGSGIKIEGQLEPSYASVDFWDDMEQRDYVIYPTWSKFTIREQEQEGTKEVKTWKESDDGTLKCEKSTDEPEAKMNSDLQLRRLLTRRALAADQVGLLTFEAMEEWHSLLFEMMEELPVGGHQSISKQQAMNADKALFRLISNDTREKGIKTQPDGTRPMLDSFRKLMRDDRVLRHLHQLPGRDSHSAGNVAKGDVPYKAPSGKDSKVKLVDPKLKKTAAPTAPTRKERLKDKGKGNSKGKMPKELIGHHSRTTEGLPICFNFNLGKTTCTVNGGRCDKGVHVCCKCLKADHGLQDKKC